MHSSTLLLEITNYTTTVGTQDTLVRHSISMLDVGKQPILV